MRDFWRPEKLIFKFKTQILDTGDEKKQETFEGLDEEELDDGAWGGEPAIDIGDEDAEVLEAGEEYDADGGEDDEEGGWEMEVISSFCFNYFYHLVNHSTVLCIYLFAVWRSVICIWSPYLYEGNFFPVWVYGGDCFLFCLLYGVICFFL